MANASDDTSSSLPDVRVRATPLTAKEEVAGTVVRSVTDAAAVLVRVPCNTPSRTLRGDEVMIEDPKLRAVDRMSVRDEAPVTVSDAV